jgi:hypothetical protein
MQLLHISLAGAGTVRRIALIAGVVCGIQPGITRHAGHGKAGHNPA